MSTLVHETPITTPSQYQNGTNRKPVRFPLPDLPTLPMAEWGHRLIDDPETGEPIEAPLTLLDLLYPTGEEFFVSEGLLHNKLSNLLQTMLRPHFGEEWLVFGNVNVYWGRPGVPPKAPDVTVVHGADSTGEDASYYVGHHGPTPQFLVEIVSPTSRQISKDRERNRIDYAALGVSEYLVIDMWSKPSESWELIGYRLEGGPFYDEIQPDVAGGITFPGVGLRFVPIGRERIDVYAVTTGERLLTPDEVQARAEQEAARAEQEAARAEQEAARAEQEAVNRAQAEARLVEAEARIKALEAELKDAK